MILTSIHCHREGLTFQSVHDCFWTHANNVETMNRICREQFVALHNQPILDDLSKHFVETYEKVPINMSVADNKKALKLLSKKLEKGSFKIENVMKSTYFFS